MDMTKQFSHRTEAMQPASIRKIIGRMKGPGYISFAPGKPAPSLFPIREIYESTGHMLEKYGGEPMQYSSTDGFQPLREWVAEHVPGASAENVLIVAGSQEAIDIVGKVFVNPGDKIAVTAPTYTAAITTLRVYGAEFINIESDEHGMLPESLEAALKQSPRFVYAIPNFMNPTGVYMSMERRQKTIDLCRQYDTPIMEDNPYGELQFEGDVFPNLFEIAPDMVIYAGTFSKVVAPGFRVAWLVAQDPAVQQKLMVAKQTGSLQVAGYTQTLLHELVSGDYFDQQIIKVKAYYKGQRDLMIAAMKEHFPPEIKYNIPVGGMFIWCELPEHINTTDLLDKTLDTTKVAYVPGEAFFADGSGKNTIRLSFSLATADEIAVGIEKLGGIFKEAIGA